MIGVDAPGVESVAIIRECLLNETVFCAKASRQSAKWSIDHM
jgi:hypothetical protein